MLPKVPKGGFFFGYLTNRGQAASPQMLIHEPAIGIALRQETVVADNFTVTTMNDKITNGGKIVAKIETIAPLIPANLKPTTIAPFTAIAPGADWAMAIKSSISFSSIQLNSSTYFFFINVTIT